MSEKITAGDILAAIRKKHSSDAVVREVVIDDPIEMGYYARASINASGGRWAEQSRAWYERRGVVIPDEIPEGWTHRSSITRRRIDAIILSSTGVTAVEIKVSRADFKRETEEKRRAWRAITNRFIYAAPVGLILPEEVPAGCGLWEFDAAASGPYRSQHGLTVKVKARVNKEPDALPPQILTALAYRVSNYERKAAA
jgi:hypothetical protein